MDFSSLFEPKTMAVIGLSHNNERHPANVIFNKNYYRYPLTVYAVNPKGGTYHKEPVYRSIGEIPERVDLALIAVRADLVPDVLRQCIDNWVGAAAIISGGFGEVGEHGLQAQLTELAAKADFPIIGPNCLGIYSAGNVDSFFLPSERMVQPEQGKVSLISQSGGILVDQMVKFAYQGVGLSRAVSIGNKAAVDELALLKYFARDRRTEVIAFYIEGFGPGQGRRFVTAAAKCPKPVIVMKAGKSAAGVRAVSSHTASIAGDHAVFSAVVRQFGIAEAQSEYEMVAFCESLSCYPRGIEGRIGIITASGGHGAVAVDICAAAGLEVPELSAELQAKIRSRLSPSVQPIASLGNPLDLTGSANDDDFVVAAAELSEHPDVDCILMLLLPYIPGVTSDVGARLSRFYRSGGKPMVAYVPHVEKFGMIIEGFQLNNVPVSNSIEGAVMMVDAMRRNRPC